MALSFTTYARCYHITSAINRDLKDVLKYVIVLKEKQNVLLSTHALEGLRAVRNSFSASKSHILHLRAIIVKRVIN